MTTMMRVDTNSHAILRDLAAQQHTSMQDVLARAVEAYRRQQLIDATSAAYAALRANPEAWKHYQAEIASLDGALTDGLTAAQE